MTSVAPRPAPAAEPSRYGSASGLRNTPWYVAPATARTPPTRATSSTRGRRSSSRIWAWTPPSGSPTCRPICWSRVATTRPGGSPTAPTPTANRTTPTSSAAAAPRAIARRRETPSRTAGSTAGRRPLWIRPSLTIQFLCHQLREVRGPRTPAGDDVVVRGDDLAVLDGRHRAERRALGHGLRGLAAALRVRQDDEVRRLLDDVLGGQLRVAAVGALGGVGDVLQAEQAVDAADEGLARRGVVVLLELVVHAQLLRGLRDRGDGGRDPVLDRLRSLGGLGLVACGLAQRRELGVAVVERLRRGQQERRDLELGERAHDAVLIVGENDEVGVVAGDGLGVRLVAGELGRRYALRVVRLVVDGDDLGAGADRPEDLGVRRGQRDDALRLRGNRHRAVRALDRDGVRGGLGGGRARRWVRGARRGGGAGRAAADRQGEDGCGEQREPGPAAGNGAGHECSGQTGAGPHAGPSPVARPLPRGSRTGGRQATWLAGSSARSPLTVAGQRRIRTGFAGLRPSAARPTPDPTAFPRQTGGMRVTVVVLAGGGSPRGGGGGKTAGPLGGGPGGGGAVASPRGRAAGGG